MVQVEVFEENKNCVTIWKARGPRILQIHTMLHRREHKEEWNKMIEEAIELLKKQRV